MRAPNEPQDGQVRRYQHKIWILLEIIVINKILEAGLDKIERENQTSKEQVKRDTYC